MSSKIFNLNSEIALKCDNINDTVSYFVDKFGFKLLQIFPADNPKVAVIKNNHVQLRLDNTAKETGFLTIYSERDSPIKLGSYTAPNGTRIEVKEPITLKIPKNIQQFTYSKTDDNSKWVVGRAGMEYRDLIPGRQNGRFIASHIKIQNGGPVPDYTHFHDIRFQIIFCYKGWVDVVYEDQGPIIHMEAGDCFLQPPLIRHQVLKSSDGLEVVEIGCPAEHATYVDHHLKLPNKRINPDRIFKDQKFIYFNSKKADETPWITEGFVCKNTNIDAATTGLGSVKIVSNNKALTSKPIYHHGEFLFLFIITGRLILHLDSHPEIELTESDCVTIPAEHKFHFENCSSNLSFLEVQLPADSVVSH